MKLYVDFSENKNIIYCGRIGYFINEDIKRINVIERNIGYVKQIWVLKGFLGFNVVRNRGNYKKMRNLKVFLYIIFVRREFKQIWIYKFYN